MSLIPTRVVDKNGRATTVHKRSGSSAVQNKKLSSANPSLGSAQKRSKIDAPFTYEVEQGFTNSLFGSTLNGMKPELALNDKSRIKVSSRQVYSLARYGFATRDCIYMAHFKLTPEEAFSFSAKLAATGQRTGRFHERPWIDAMLAADMDHFDLLKAYDNGLTQHDLDEMPPENAPDVITAYGYKGFSKTKLAEKVRDGKIAWSDIKLMGVSRATKHEWTIVHAMDRNIKGGEQNMTLPILNEIIRDAEKRPRNTLDSSSPLKPEVLIERHTECYLAVGDKFWDLHMPEVIDPLGRIVEAKKDLSGYAGYCDDVIHRVRSSAGLAESVISANGGKSKSYVAGSYPGQYGEQRDPVWNFATLVMYRDAGLSVDECVYALSKGLHPDRAQGVLREGVPLAVNDGWL